MSQLVQIYGQTLDHGLKEDLGTQLYNVLRNEILRGRWGVGERIPSYKALTEQTGLGQWHIQRALDRLDKEGYVERIRHKGIFVKTTATPSNESLGTVLMVVPEENTVRERFGSRRLAIETQGFGQINAEGIVEAGEKLGLQIKLCRVEPDATKLPRHSDDDTPARLFGILSMMSAERLKQLRDPDCPAPAIYLGTDDRFSTPCLTGDPFMAAYRVTEHLLGHGHKHIAVMPDPHLHADGAQDAFDGIATAMRHAGLDVTADDLPLMRHPSAPVPAGATAILSLSIELAQLCYRELTAKGLRIPEDISVASLQVGRTLGNEGPSITGAVYPWDEILSACFDMLLTPDRFGKQRISHISFDPTAPDDRDSTGPAPRA